MRRSARWRSSSRRPSRSVAGRAAAQRDRTGELEHRPPGHCHLALGAAMPEPPARAHRAASAGSAGGSSPWAMCRSPRSSDTYASCVGAGRDVPRRGCRATPAAAAPRCRRVGVEQDRAAASPAGCRPRSRAPPPHRGLCICSTISVSLPPSRRWRMDAPGNPSPGPNRPRSAARKLARAVGGEHGDPEQAVAVVAISSRNCLSRGRRGGRARRAAGRCRAAAR